MATDYNSRLKPVAYKGLCGDQEIVENERILEGKVNAFAQLVQSSRHIVLFTGAGLSTSCGIPDFRGPNGVWTKEQRGDTTQKINTFDKAAPSFGHLAIACLVDCGVFAHVVSQNVDGLHLRSGVPENKLSELHGNIFKEKCDTCGIEYFRDFDVGGMGLSLTGRNCDNASCNGPLRDMAVDWDTELPKRIFHKAHTEHDKADLVICLGTSLRIRPAGNMPLRVLRPKILRNGQVGKLVIINLQKTHLDNKAAIKISHYCDGVMKLLCEKIGVKVLDPATVPANALISERYVVLPGSIAANRAVSSTNATDNSVPTTSTSAKAAPKGKSGTTTKVSTKSKRESQKSDKGVASIAKNRGTDEKASVESEVQPRKLQKLRDNNRALYWDPIA